MGNYFNVYSTLAPMSPPSAGARHMRLGGLLSHSRVYARWSLVYSKNPLAQIIVRRPRVRRHI